MHSASLLAFSFLLAVCFDIPSSYGASIARDLEQDSVELLKRQGSLGAYGNYGPGGWQAGASGTYKDGNTNYSGKLGVDQNGQWGGNLGVTHTWNDGRTSLGGNLGYQSGSGPSVGVTFRHRFRK